jgi:hypothetical protein
LCALRNDSEVEIALTPHVFLASRSISVSNPHEFILKLTLEAFPVAVLDKASNRVKSWFSFKNSTASQSHEMIVTYSDICQYCSARNRSKQVPVTSPFYKVSFQCDVVLSDLFLPKLIAKDDVGGFDSKEDDDAAHEQAMDVVPASMKDLKRLLKSTEKLILDTKTPGKLQVDLLPRDPNELKDSTTDNQKRDDECFSRSAGSVYFGTMLDQTQEIVHELQQISDQFAGITSCNWREPSTMKALKHLLEDAAPKCVTAILTAEKSISVARKAVQDSNPRTYAREDIGSYLSMSLSCSHTFEADTILRSARGLDNSIADILACFNGLMYQVANFATFSQALSGVYTLENLPSVLALQSLRQAFTNGPMSMAYAIHQSKQVQSKLEVLTAIQRNASRVADNFKQLVTPCYPLLKGSTLLDSLATKHRGPAPLALMEMHSAPVVYFSVDANSGKPNIHVCFV